MKTNNQLIAEDKDIHEVTGNLIILIVCAVALFFFHHNISLSLILTAVGVFVGILYSRHYFEQWSSFLANKAIKDAKGSTIKHRFFQFSYLIMIWFAVGLINKYSNIRFEVMVGVLEVMIGCAIGYFLWLLRLHSEFKKR